MTRKQQISAGCAVTFGLRLGLDQDAWREQLRNAQAAVRLSASAKSLSVTSMFLEIFRASAAPCLLSSSVTVFLFASIHGLRIHPFF